MSRGCLPPRQGLYDPANEHDACGVGFVANINGTRNHDIVTKALEILCRLEHRGAVGADPKAGDGAGILFQVPDHFLRENVDFELPEFGQYAVGMVFLPKEPSAQARAIGVIESFIQQENQTLLGWRYVPVNSKALGDTIKPTEPDTWQVFIQCADGCEDVDAFERKLFVIRKQIENQMALATWEGSEAVYFSSLFRSADQLQRRIASRPAGGLFPGVG